MPYVIGFWSLLMNALLDGWYSWMLLPIGVMWDIPSRVTWSEVTLPSKGSRRVVWYYLAPLFSTKYAPDRLPGYFLKFIALFALLIPVAVPFLVVNGLFLPILKSRSWAKCLIACSLPSEPSLILSIRCEFWNRPPYPFVADVYAAINLLLLDVKVGLKLLLGVPKLCCFAKVFLPIWFYDEL